MISKLILGYLFSNYGFCLNWDWVSGERPSYMWTGAFKPCECKKCFFSWRAIQMVLPIIHESKQKLLWITNAGCGSRRTSLPTCRLVLGWNQGLSVRFVTESNSLLNWVQRRGRRHAEALRWDVQSARSPFAKSAGKKGAINMHDFT